MPRFFFEIVQDGNIQEDHVGVDLPSMTEVEPFAVRMAAEALLMAAEIEGVKWWLMEVRDEGQAVVGRVSFVTSGFGEPTLTEAGGPVCHS